MQRNVLALASLLCAASIAMAGCGSSRVRDSASTSTAGSQASTGATAVPKTSPKASASSEAGSPPAAGESTHPPGGSSGANGSRVIPPDASAIVASMIVQRLGVVTDRTVYGPVTVTDPSRVSKVVALLNAEPRERVNAMRCPMQADGGMTLVFHASASASGPVVATVLISTSGCPGVTVRPATGGVVFLAGGADAASQIITILGVPWPKP